MFMLLAKVHPRDFGLTENEFLKALAEQGIQQYDTGDNTEYGYLIANNPDSLIFAAIEGCIEGDIIEYTQTIKVEHDGYGDINP